MLCTWFECFRRYNFQPCIEWMVIVLEEVWLTMYYCSLYISSCICFDAVSGCLVPPVTGHFLPRMVNEIIWYIGWTINLAPWGEPQVIHQIVNENAGTPCVGKVQCLFKHGNNFNHIGIDRGSILEFGGKLLPYISVQEHKWLDM